MPCEDLGLPIQDRVSLIYTDTPFAFRENLPMPSLFVGELRLAADESLDEEALLVTAFPVYHPEQRLTCWPASRRADGVHDAGLPLGQRLDRPGPAVAPVAAGRPVAGLRATTTANSTPPIPTALLSRGSRKASGMARPHDR